MDTTFDAIVCGTGGIGSSAAFHLARRGLRVLGLDRFPGGHDRGSSHGQTRIIRKAYFEHSNYVPLLHRAYDLWSELEQLTGTQLLHQVGLVQVGLPTGDVVRGVLRSAAEHGLDVEQWSAADCRRNGSPFRVPENCVAVYERQAGFLLVEKCVLAHLQQARSHGAELRTDEYVIDWRGTSGGVSVTTNRRSYSSQYLVLAAGAWSQSLLGSLGISLTVLRKHLHWFAIDDRRFEQQQGCPTFLFDLPAGCFYGFPAVDEWGLKVAEHSRGSEVQDPLLDPRLPEPDDDARVAAFVRDCLPGVSDRQTQSAVCFYTMSPDHHFIVDSHPEFPHIGFVAGLSGHGFKFASVLGEVLADFCTRGATSHPVGFLGLQRFSP